MSWLPHSLLEPAPRSAGTRGKRPSPLIARRNEVIRAERAAGASTDELSAKYNLSIPSILAVTRGIKSGKRRQNDARDKEWNQRYIDGTNATEIAKEAGVTRERVCQILRKTNTISHVAERRRLAREAMQSAATAIKDAARAEFEAQITRGIELVRQGYSIAEATQSVGLIHGNGSNALGAACKKAGVQTRWGRWRELGPTLARARELRAAGKTWNDILAILPTEGFEPISTNIIHRHLPDLVRTNAPRVRKTKPERVPVPVIAPPAAKSEVAAAPGPDSEWTPVRVAALVSHWLNGCSAAQCADLLGPPFTRNSVIGKINRLRNADELRAAIKPEDR